MKRRMATILVMVSILSSTFLHAEGWTPGNPKPPIPDPWYMEFAGFFTDIWTFLVY